MKIDVLTAEVIDTIAVVALAYIKRLVNANETPLADGLVLERNLFLRLCTSDTALARMRNYEEKKITEPSRGFEVDEKVVNHA